MQSTPKLMQEMELRYQERSGLRDRDRYTIFFSQICQSDLLVLGINPGGDPKDPRTIIRASTRYYESWEHEYVDSHYPIQAVMKPFLKNVLGARDAQLRYVPKSNLVFRRAPNEDRITPIHRISKSEAYREAAPTIREIMQFVQPKLILLEGMKDKQFQQLYSSGESIRLIEPLKTFRQGSWARILDAALVNVTCLDRRIPVVALGHPSHSGHLPIWGAQVVPTVRQLMQDYGVRARTIH